MEKLPETADEMFCFAVYKAGHAINRAYAPLLKTLGLTYPQYITLTLLWQVDGQKVGELSRKLGMESSTVTPLLKRLEKLGHIERRRDTADERKVMVFLSEQGRALSTKASEITRCMVEQTGMEASDLDELVDNLSILSANLGAFTSGE
ncbi:MAG: MarR family winged helix-turn-helix transcriptional regulator [Pikeienuella sp.]